MSIVALLTDPRGFFAERSDDPSVLYPAIVVLVLGLLTAASTIPSTRATMAAMGGEGQSFGSILVVVSAGFLFVLTVVFWLLWAGIFHGITALFDGEGSFTGTLAVTGWGFTPQLISALASLGASYVVYSGADLTASGEDPQAIAQTVQQLQSDPLIMSAGVIGIVLTLWSGALWTFGVAEARDVDLRQALVPVGLVVLVSIALSVWQLV